MTTTTATPNVFKRCQCGDRQYRCPCPWYLDIRHPKREKLSLKLWAKRHGIDYAKTVKSKADAEDLAKKVLAERAGLTPDDAPTLTAEGPRTFEALCADYLKVRDRDRETDDGRDQDRTRCAILGAIVLAGEPVSAWLVSRFKNAHIGTLFSEATKSAEKGERGNSSRRKYRGTIKRLFAHAVRFGYLTTNPITDDSVMKAGKCAIRRKRVLPDLEGKLIRAAEKVGGFWGAWLARLIVCAVDSGARKGELLAVKVRDVNLKTRTILITAQEQGARKTGKGSGRPVPISDRMLPILIEMLSGALHQGIEPSPDAYLFGTYTGKRVRCINRRWQALVLLAHDITPDYVKTGKTKQSLTKACWAALRRIDLKFHDLRHEAAHRWNEGVGLEKPLRINHIAKLLGHSDIKQLEVYLGINQDDALAAYAEATGQKTEAVQQRTAKPATVLPFRQLAA